jgi:hypothetical protein
MENGIIDEYYWAQLAGEEPELSVGDVVRGLSEHIVGLRGVNVSWDSGRLKPSESQMASGWKVHCGYAITPSIDTELIASWPENPCSIFDEWYFFRDVPAQIRLDAYCNWYMKSIGEWQNLVDCQPNNIDLGGQLQTYRLEVVIGENSRFVFVIAHDPTIIRAFESLAHEP